MKKEYNLNIIGKTVNNIEWMHACFFFIEELYHKNTEFSWVLLAHLVEKYPMKKSFDICLQYLDYISKIFEYLSKGNFQNY